jgi:SPP1 gp7 family putative phage head morphogenesis protein
VKRLRGVYGDLNFVTKQEIQRLERKIKQQEDNGVPRTVVQEQTLLSLQQTIADIQKALTGIAPAAQSVIEEGREKIVRTANDSSSNVVTSLLPDGVETEAVFSRLNEGQVQALVASLDSGPLADTLAAMPNNVGQSLAGFLTNNAVRQINPRQLAREFYKRYQDVSRQRVEVIARTELIRSAREAQRDIYEQNDIVMGYERQAAQDGRVCLGCLVLSGKVYSKNEIMPSHPMCRCVMLPVLPDPSWFTGNTSKPIPKYTAIGPDELMAGMDEEELLAVFGPTRYKQYKEGKVKLDAFVGVNENPRWGPQVNIKPLRDVDGTVTLPPDAPLHIPVRRPDLNKPKPNKPVPVPVPPVTPPVTPPVLPPITPPVLPPITPPTIPVPPKRKPGRPPTPKPPVAPPVPKPVPAPKPAPTPKPPKAPPAPKLPPAPKPPIVTQPTASGKPSPQSKRLRKTTLGKQSDVNPYRFWDPQAGRYVLDGGKWMEDFGEEGRKLLARQQELVREDMEMYRDTEAQKDALRVKLQKGELPYDEWKKLTEEVRQKYIDARDVNQAKRDAQSEEFKLKVWDSLKAHTRFGKNTEVLYYDGKGVPGTANAKALKANLDLLFNMVEDRQMRPVKCYGGPLANSDAGCGGFQTDKAAHSEVHARISWPARDKREPRLAGREVAWHEFTHFLHGNTDSSRPNSLISGTGTYAEAVKLWDELTATMKIGNHWFGRGYQDFADITRNYGGRVYDWEKRPNGAGLEMLTTMTEVLHGNPIDMFRNKDSEKVAQFLLEYIL